MISADRQIFIYSIIGVIGYEQVAMFIYSKASGVSGSRYCCKQRARFGVNRYTVCAGVAYV